ncbi:MAG: CRTAC1 family protein [Silicimonas sp.]|nr:CRTAC1 family protein [Silicimonas sp.]
MALSVAEQARGEEEALLSDVPVMLEEAAAAGIEHVYSGPWEYFVGGGAASFDCNGDRLPDLFLAGGKGGAALYMNRSKPGGALTFERQDTGVSPRDLEKVTGAYPLDIDNDGVKDIVVLRVGENVLLKGEGDCRFRNANREFAFDGGREWTTAFSATFEAKALWPTLAFGNYVDRMAPGSPWGTCHDNILIRALGPEHGLPELGDAQTLKPGFCALSMLFTDWNKSGEPALRVTNDRQYYRGGEEQLWQVSPGRPARLYGRGDGWQSVVIWGMGIAEGDIDGDGYPEYALTSMGDTRLQVLDDDFDSDRPVYRDIAYDKGATAHRPYTGDDLKPSTGWHSEFADFNNDSLLDLFIAKGNVEQMPDFAAHDPDNLLLGQWSGRFAEAGEKAGIALPTKGRGAIIDDFNMDGQLDLLVVNRGGPASLFRNAGTAVGNRTVPSGNWLAVEITQDGPNRDAIGATVSIKIGTRTLIRKQAVGGGHASGHLGFIHAGLGTAERADIRILWPDGEWSPSYRVFANNHVVIRRNASDAAYWYPVRD